MNSKFYVTAAAAGMFLFAGCNFFIQAPEPTIPIPATTIMASNEMADFDMVIRGTTWVVEGIDLYNVTIGDLSYSAILAGQETRPVVTGESGRVDVYIGSAVAMVDLPGPGGVIVRQPYEFNNIGEMEITINDGEDNLVVFDEATSATILSALAKKLAPK